MIFILMTRSSGLTRKRSRQAQSGNEWEGVSVKGASFKLSCYKRERKGVGHLGGKEHVWKLRGTKKSERDDDQESGQRKHSKISGTSKRKIIVGGKNSEKVIGDHSRKSWAPRKKENRNRHVLMIHSKPTSYLGDVKRSRLSG